MLDFPASPINGQQFLAQNGATYQWIDPPSAWTIVAGSTDHGTVLDSPILTGNPTAPTPPPGDNDTSIATTEFVRSVMTSASPEQFEAVGNGSADDSDAITAWLAYCLTNNLRAVTTPGKSYKLRDDFVAFIRVPFDGTGSEFIASNNGQANSVFIIESVATDIQNVTVADTNLWTTGLYRGSRQIPALTERNWSYWIATQSEIVLKRSDGTTDLKKGEAFATVSDDGYLSKDLCFTYTLPLAAPAATVNIGERRHIREWMQVKGLVVRLTSGGGGRDEVIRIHRPRTQLLGCEILNDTTGVLDQGFEHVGTTAIVYDQCRVNGTRPSGVTTTNYGWNGVYCDDVTFRSCSALMCRRDIDGHVVSNYKIDGGSFPDGVGGHWVNGFHVYGKAFIGQSDSLNVECIQIAGSDVDIESARIHMSPTTSIALSMRSDFPEIRGVMRLGPNVEVIVDEAVTPGLATKYIVRIDAQPYDSERAVFWPNIIEIHAAIRQLGPTSGNTNLIRLLSLPQRTENATTGFPQDIIQPLRIDIAPSSLLLQSGFASGAVSRIFLSMNKSSRQTGDPCKVFIDKIQRFDLFSDPASGAAYNTQGRYDFDINNVDDAGIFTFRPGAYRHAMLTQVNPATTVNTGTGSVSPVGDEWVRWSTQSSTYTATPGTITGYVTITDAGGVTRKLAVTT